VCDLAEIHATFAAPSHHADRRRVFEELQGHIRNPLVVAYVNHIYVNGSFASDRPAPGDVDILLGLKPGTLSSLMTMAIVNPASVVETLQGRFTAFLKGKHLVHGFVDEVGGPIYQRALAYFQRSDRLDEPRQKGILRVEVE
jgi:hypothetical protein